MSDPRDHHRHIALWIAVGGTGAAVIALWALILPTQMRNIRLEGEQSRSRWTVLETEGEGRKKSFDEIIQEQRAKLDQLEKESAERNAATAPADDAGPAQETVEDLTVKIEAAGTAKAEPTDDIR